jgi:hypothetical protein
MKTKLLILSFFALTCIAAFSQGFTLVDGGMVSVGRSSVAWGDYDMDGDLDVLLTGDHGSGPYVASVYRNDAGEFVNINAGLTGIYNSSVAWGDYDNDGDLDIIACGRNSSNSKTYIYQNSNGAFTQLEAGLPDIGSDGAVAWGDYDGDGDLDILIAGAYSCRIFNNQSGLFTAINSVFPAVSNCWVDWGDFDNDGDLDVFVMGDLGGILISAIYQNTGGQFSEMPQAGITPLAGGSSSWRDFDGDDDPDLLITGFNEYLEPQTAVFENLGHMEFANIYPGLIGTALGTAAWGDYDNDGDADILLTGQNAGCGIFSSLVYRNNGNSSFSDIGAPLEGAERGSAAWGDYDNDGDADILLSGINEAGNAITRLYSNDLGSNTFSINMPPSVPDGLSMYINRHSVTLGWNKSTDDHTPANGLTYNLRIGTSTGAQDVLTAMVDPVSGSRLLPQAGNTGSNTDWVVNLPDGTYFWSVQAIDHTFAASPFSYEQIFTILNVDTEKSEPAGINVFPNPVSDRLILSAANAFEYEICSPDGRILKPLSKGFHSAIINTSNWAAGLYTVKIISPDKVMCAKVIKQ